MFGILAESKESKVAVPVAIVLVIVWFVVTQLVDNPAVLDFLIPFVSLLLGCAIGWVIGEAFTYASGVGKFILGGVSALFGTSVTLDALRQRVESSREKVFYLLSLIPITSPRIVNSLLWFALAFVVVFIISIGVNFTRRMDKEK